MEIDIEKVVQDFDEKALARDKLKYFMIYTDPMADAPSGAYSIKPFHKKILDAFERVERGEIKRLMISVPAQHGKSRISSIGYPAWTLGRNPYQHVRLCSYAAELSESFSREARALLRSDEYKSLFGPILSPDSQGIGERKTIKGGTYGAVGVGGGFTGKVADKIIIDDPFRDYEDSQSPSQRQKVWNRYNSVVLTRARVNTAIIIIMTRRHEDDLCGRLLDLEGDKREVINIPVFNDDGSVIRPELHPKELIEAKRASQGESMFQAMYMGDPINEGGGDFKSEYLCYYENGDIWDEYGVNLKKKLQVMTFIDPAISQKQRADDTAIVTCGLDRTTNNIYVLDVRHGRMLPDEIINNVFQVVERFNPIKVGIETNQYQKMLELELRKSMRSRGIFFNLEGTANRGEKTARIVGVLQRRYSNLTILHPKRGVGIGELESQLLKFPNAKHDDIIDALAGCIYILGSATTQQKSKIVRANWI